MSKLSDVIENPPADILEWNAWVDTLPYRDQVAEGLESLGAELDLLPQLCGDVQELQETLALIGGFMVEAAELLRNGGRVH